MDTFMARRMLVQVGGVIAIAAILGGFIVAYNATYAGVVDLEEQVDARWAGILRDMAGRYAGIPGLAPGLGDSLGPDAPAIGEVMRNLDRWNAAVSDGDMEGINRATTRLEDSLSRLAMVLERHPEIEASGGVQGLLADLEVTEGTLSSDRVNYNEGVREYNRALVSFPASLWTENWGFVRREYFTAKIGGKEPPPVPVE